MLPADMPTHLTDVRFRGESRQEAGFVLVASKSHRSFGQRLIGETGERDL